MINEEKRQALATGLQYNDRATVEDVLKGLGVDELEALQEVLQEMLPNKTFASINLEHELMHQFGKVKKLQTDVMDDDQVPVNQRAQVANAVAGTLQQLIKMQSDYNNAERFKAIEALMIKAMRTLPVEVANKFLEEYEAMS